MNVTAQASWTVQWSTEEIGFKFFTLSGENWAGAKFEKPSDIFANLVGFFQLS